LASILEVANVKNIPKLKNPLLLCEPPKGYLGDASGSLGTAVTCPCVDGFPDGSTVTKYVAAVRDSVWVSYNKVLQKYTAPFVMAGVNTRVASHSDVICNGFLVDIYPLRFCGFAHHRSVVLLRLLQRMQKRRTVAPFPSSTRRTWQWARGSRVRLSRLLAPLLACC
jgi:hypothetical protein